METRCPILPGVRSSKINKKHSFSVIVIGAGISGLAAAWALRSWSCKIIVLESRDRLGGRIHTDYSHGFPVDMGASWLHGMCQDNPLAGLISSLGLRLYRTSGDNSVLYDHDLQSYALFDMDGQQVPPSLVTRVGEIFKATLEEAKRIRNEYENDMSVSRAFSLVLEKRPDLRLEGLAFKVLQWYICRMEGWFAADADKISLRCVDEEELLEGGHGLMVNGYTPVLMALAEDLDIRLNHRYLGEILTLNDWGMHDIELLVVVLNRVGRIVHKFRGVQVHTEDGKVFNADACVVTVPLGVLKESLIKFEPRLPEWKEAAIKDLGTGNENKIALFFDSACWPNVEFLGLVASTSYGCSYFLNLHKATGHPVLVYMPAGSLANDIEKMSDAAAVSFAVLQLKRIVPNAKEPVGYLVSRWGSDINSLGCYSYDAIGRPHDLYARMRSPVDNIFFAGEATSANFPGTVHGAFLTGLMAAEDCCKSFLEHYQHLAMFQPVMGEEAGPSMVTPLLISRM